MVDHSYSIYHGAICDIYIIHVKTKYPKSIVVFDEYNCGQSTKATPCNIPTELYLVHWGFSLTCHGWGFCHVDGVL